MRAMARQILVLLALLLGLPVLLLSMPLLLWLSTLLIAHERRRQRTAVATTPCARCGRILGAAALDAADAAWRLARPVFDGRHIKRRPIVQSCHALCTACGAAYGWDDRRSTFAKLPDPPDAEPTLRQHLLTT